MPVAQMNNSSFWTFPLQVTVVLFHPTDHPVAAAAIELSCAWRQCVEQLGSIETLDLVASAVQQDIPATPTK